MILEFTSGDSEIDFYEYDDESKQPGKEDIDLGV
jgi:hypothetical protein